MPLHVYRVGDFSRRAKKKAFAQVVEALRCYSERERELVVLIGNYRAGGMPIDALLLTRQRSVVLTFMDLGGEVVAAEGGDWTADGRIVHSEMAGKTPLAQVRLERHCVARFFKEQIPTASERWQLHSCLLFCQEVSIRDEALTEQTRSWLKVAQLETFSDYLAAYAAPAVLTDAELESLEAKLHLKSFALDAHLQHLHPQASYRSYAAQAADFFSTLVAMSEDTDLSLYERCRTLYQVLRQAADERLQEDTIIYAGLFPKVEHLLKECDAPAALTRAVHDARAQLRKSDDIPIEQLRKAYPFHLRAVCRFLSLIYDQAPIPSTLQLLFPAEEHRKPRPRRLEKVLRVTVETWDDTYLYALRQDTGEAVKVDYTTQTERSIGNWAYLKDLLSPRCQLNLIHPRLYKQEGTPIVHPELIIFEPDCLVNVTSIASCFTEYCALPYLHFLQRFQPYALNEHVALGNFSGQLLDEAIRGEKRSVRESARDFFHANAMTLSVGAPNFEQMCQNGERQSAHIRRALRDIVSTEAGERPEAADRANGKADERHEAADRTHGEAAPLMVEPTFFSEQLGIMGRMDLFRLDKRLVVEQKSGKGAWGSTELLPKARQPHFVQLNLYRALIHYGFGISNSDLRTLFLYSRYENPVVDQGHSPRLLFESLKIRNQIVWCDLLYAREGFRFLDTLRPEMLRRRAVSDSFWECYCRPALQAILQPIHQASPLERAYFYRFLQFIQKEFLHAKLGSAKKEDAGFAATWHASLAEKANAGSICYELSLRFPEETMTVSRVRFALDAPAAAASPNFRKGDTVILYPYKGIPDACAEMVFRAIVSKVSAEEMEVEFLNAQTSRKVFSYYTEQGYQWALEHDLLEATFSALFRGTYALLTTTPERRALLLTTRPPRIDASQTLRGDYGAFNDLALRAKQSRDCFLLLGPPGTGKTSHGLLTLVREELTDETSSVLLLAYTHRAVDEICEKLIEQGIDFVRLGKKSSTEVPEEYLFEHRALACPTPEETLRLIRRTRIFCATASNLNGNASLFAAKRFSLAIIDEASQLLEPQAMGILTALHRGAPAVERFVLIGDHKQLPAVVTQDAQTSAVADPLLQEIGLTNCRHSLFERLHRRWGADPRHCYMLTHQGRMHEEIAAFPNAAFYDGRLAAVPLPHQTAPLRPCPAAEGIAALFARHRLFFLALANTHKESCDKTNQAEAALIASVIKTVYARYTDSQRPFRPAQSVGVIVPYRHQIATVRQALLRYGIAELAAVTIDTVERYQGSQRDVIIYGFTVQRAYQLNFLTANTFEEQGRLIDRKLNVAMTRAREHLVLIGDASLLARAPVFASLLSHIRQRGAYYHFDTTRGAVCDEEE